MTNLSVKEIGIMTPVVNEPGGVVPTGRSAQDFMGSLKSAIETQSTAMNMAPTGQTSADMPVSQADSSDRRPEQVEGPSTTGRMERDDHSVKNEVRKDAKGGTARDAGKEPEEVSPEVVEAVSETTREIVNEVSEELDVATEDVLAAMEPLGLGMTDLLDPANMSDLVATISGEQDAVALITDENLYQTLNNLQEYVTNVTNSLMEELDLSQEALNEVLVQTEELIGQAASEIVPETENLQLQGELLSEAVDEQAPQDYKVTTTVDGERVTLNMEVDQGTGVASTASVETQESQGNSGNPSDTGRGGEHRNTGAETHVHNPELTQTVQFNNEINNVEAFTNAAEEVASFRTEASDIANQIMESMRANIRDDVTELEMNLHPASLGNVRVNLVSQNGQVTAQFMAQNETVRAAIESQVVQLRESLESQGIKIEAVEVTVAYHEFDRGSDTAGQHQDEAAREEARARLGRTRRIDLSDLGDIEIGELSDEDRIAAEMMADAGNQVDYKA